MIDYTAARTAMVDCQVRPSDVTRYPIIAAMLDVPREKFVPTDMIEVAYAGEHIVLASGRVLLDPRTFSKMLEAADITPSDLVLDVGAGLGYSTAVVARLAEAVVGVEDDADRSREAEALLREVGADNAIISSGPLAEGDAANGPYDVIMIEGGVEVVPDALAAQLKEGGRIVTVFSDGVSGHVRHGIKSGGRITWRTEFDATAPVLSGFGVSAEFTF